MLGLKFFFNHLNCAVIALNNLLVLFDLLLKRFGHLLLLGGLLAGLKLGLVQLLLQKLDVSLEVLSQLVRLLPLLGIQVFESLLVLIAEAVEVFYIVFLHILALEVTFVLEGSVLHVHSVVLLLDMFVPEPKLF
jgi:hypothetical protein